MTSSIVRSVSIVLAAGAAAIAAAPASASAIEYDAASSLVIGYGDLDLTTDDGVGRLNRRIATAARAVCGSFHPAELAVKNSVLACRKTTKANAAPAVEVAVAAARGGQQLAANALTVGKPVP